MIFSCGYGALGFTQYDETQHKFSLFWGYTDDVVFYDSHGLKTWFTANSIWGAIRPSRDSRTYVRFLECAPEGALG